jgi:carboxyl-terminal processing protease
MKQKIKTFAIGLSVSAAITISIGFQSDFFEIAKQIDIYTTMFKELNIYYVDEINPAELTKQAINNTLENLDPYTRYYDEQGVEDARIASSGEYGGIGALTRYSNNKLIIREIVKGSPAEESGLRPGDYITGINNIAISDFDEQGAATLLNGLPNTKVNLEIQRQNQSINLDVTRKKITINPVPYVTMLNEEVGYISFTQFNNSASREVKRAFDELKAEGMKKLIIDVRSNPGGLLNEAVRIVNYFIPRDNIVVTTKGKKEKWSDTYKTMSNPVDLEIPLVVLVNNRSASASEILAGSLQDYDRAVIIGQRSFGKGLVQRYRELSYGTQMKVTISKYYTPSGRCIQELDYANRDENGTVPKFSDYGRKQFKTMNGRTVFGGGGILPDVEIDKNELTKTTEILLQSDALFNYATQYYYTHTNVPQPSNFVLKESDYKEFRNYLSNHQTEFETNSEAQFKTALKTAESDALASGMAKNYTNLLESLYRQKLMEIDKNKKEILEELTEELVKRYYYSEGVYEQKAVFDEVIQEAVKILEDQKEFNSLLGK